MNQMVVTDMKQCKKVIMTVALPGNVQGVNNFSVEFAPGSNRCGLMMWVPSGMVNANTDKLATVLAKLERKGITSGDAILVAQALETKLMDKCKNKHAGIYDPFLIPLEVQCDINKQPIVTHFRTTGDGDNGCFIVLDVPSVSDYAAGVLEDLQHQR
jgi:hypothetical protein